jgi:hypothetical protein
VAGKKIKKNILKFVSEFALVTNNNRINGSHIKASDYFCFVKIPESIPVAERSKKRVCGRSLAVIAGSNPAVGMDVCVAC